MLTVYYFCMKKSVIVIPTYNSKKSIKNFLRKVLKHAPSAKLIVVDDNSPDGTAKEIKKYFSKNRQITLIVRKRKEGRGSAVIQGFKEGLKNKSIKLFIEMDSDFAHNPSDLPKIIKKTKSHDVVVASRYRLHSHIIKWSLKRRLISRFANLWIKFMLGVSLTDNTNGFRCYSRRVIEAINFDIISAKGFIVLTEIAYQIYKKGFSFGEIPINFTPVDLNKSNLNIKEIREAFLTVLRLKITSFKTRSYYFKFWQRKNKASARH